jgi:hypothetical protein
MKQTILIGYPNSDGSGKPVVYGPPTSDKEFAPWAPAEGSLEAAPYLDWLVAEFRGKLH